MQPRWEQLERYVDDFIDGRQVEWKTASRSGSDESERAAIDSLGVIASIARFDADVRSQQTIPIDIQSVRRDRWGELTLLEKIGEGSTAEVYRVHDPRLEMDLALKLPRRDRIDESEHRRILEEARALARVDHQSVVRIYRVEEHSEQAGIVMEYIRGRSLDQLVKESGPVGEESAIQYGKTIAEALAAIHASGLIHRDVKAQNVVLADRGRLVLMDLGCGVQRAVAEDKLGTWSIEGTPYYMAPELLSGAPPSVRTDVYSLGVLLFFLTTGDYPVHGRTWDELRRNHRRGRDSTLLDLRPELDPNFTRVVEKAIHPDPIQRFASTGQLIAELVELQRGKLPEPKRKRILARWMSVGAAALVIVASLWFYLGQMEGPPPLDVDVALYRQRDAQRERLISGSSVAPGDLLVLQLNSSASSFVYVLSEDDRGVASLLFPLPGGELQNPLPADEALRLPGTVGGVERGWRISSVGGRERLLVVASTERLPALEALLERLPVAGAISYPEIDEMAMVQLRGIMELGPLASPSESSFGDLFEQATDAAGESGRLFLHTFELMNPGD